MFRPEDQKNGFRKENETRYGKQVFVVLKKKLLEMQIPVEELENIDELVGDGYYGNRRDAIQDIIRRGAAQFLVQ